MSQVSTGPAAAPAPDGGLVAVLVVVGLWTLTGLVAGWSAVRLLGWERGNLAAQLMAFTPYVAAGSLLPVAAALWTRHWVMAVVAVLACAGLAAAVLPRTVGHPSTVDGVRLVVMAANLRVGEADAQSIVDIVDEWDVDVLTLQELTPAAYDRLVAAGLEKLLPHAELAPAAGGAGAALFSRYELSDPTATTNPGRGFSQVSAVIAVPGAAAVEVHSVHPEPPTTADSGWAAGLRAEPPARAATPRRILAGDFNATLDHAELRRLRDTGYRDAASEVGRGLVPTWPYAGHRRPVVPKVTLDHVFVDMAMAVRSFDVADVPGSDHRAIIAVVVLPGA